MSTNLPCIIGVAQHTWRANEGDAPEPLVQWELMARAAAKDAGNEAWLLMIDEVDVVFSLSWNYDDAPAQLAEKLGIKKYHQKLSGLSGTSPQKFINEAAEQIIAGKSELALIVGGEALATKKKAKKEERKLSWAKPQAKPMMPFDDPFHPSEVAHQIFQAYLTFAMLDSARRKHHGLSLLQNREQEAAMMASLSQIAVKSPDAWFPKAYGKDELLDTSGSNRFVAWPFTKLQMAFMDVDMAAAVIIASDKKADELGVPKEKRIYLHGWSYAREPVTIAERPELWHSPAMEIASQQALNMAGIGSQEITHFDLYSCFPSSLNFTRDALGIPENDTRKLSVTGGLPYFGGPGNNYTAHSIVAMVNTLRQHPGDYGLVSGVGMHMTNHVFSIYSSTPPVKTPTPPDYAKARHFVESIGKKEIVNEANGTATIAACSILYAPDKNTAYAVCDLPDGKRCYAICDDAAAVAKMEQEESIGKTVTLHSDGKVNRF
jgi:acetyl-CoA C-acetyltransferase